MPSDIPVTNITIIPLRADKRHGIHKYFKEKIMQNNKKETLEKAVVREKKPASEGRSHHSRYEKIKLPQKAPSTPVKIAFLGGLNEVGKNMTLYEYNGDMFIVDCGLAFPDTEMFGVDFVIPDFTYVERNKDKIKGIIITHGHEDHIGGLAYLLKALKIPVYATRLTAGLIEGKLAEHKLDDGSVKMNVVKPGDHVKFGAFDVELIRVNHSIPDSVAFAIRSPAGLIIQTGDFKIDTTPIDGGMIDLARFAALGNEGVLCMLSDSTNAENPGFSQSESKVGESFESLFQKAGNKRLIIATFASNIHRVQQIINIAEKTGRKVVLSGRSLEHVVEVGSQLGYLNIPDGVLIGIDMIKKYTDDKLVIITTGSQGEPMSALSRMALSEHRKVEITPNDYVIISAKPIPGNEKTVYRVINELLKLGAEVIYEKMYEVHVSGHACQEELKLMLGLVKPKFFIPVHGEQKHLRRHASLAEGMGIPTKNIVISDNGYEVSITSESIAVSGTVPAGKVFVDGYGVGDVGSVVMRDRRHLGQDGLVIVTAVIDSASGEFISGPEVVSRGFVYVREAEKLINEIKECAADVMDSFSGTSDVGAVRNKIKDDISRLLYERTKRSPMVLPLIIEV